MVLDQEYSIKYETLKNKGNEKFRAKDYKNALSYYTDAIALKDDESIAYSNRALCYINLERFFEAKEDCDKAIGLDPTFVKAYYRRATALKNLSRYQKAIDDFQKVTSLDPSFKLAEKEIATIKSLIKTDSRLDLRIFDKPAIYRSDTKIKTFELKNQYIGMKSYKL